ncbi:MAG: group II intron reverse transcriptase/maturase [Anaerolineae bacterium]
MVDVVRELGHLAKLAQADPEKRFNRLYRLLRQPEFLMLAKAKVEGNKGANTPGVDGQVMDDVTPEAIIKLSQELATGTYQPQPVRRTYIPKRRNKTQQRPLGMPTSRDKVIQAGVALILEALYEPLFRDCSHGFRPGRSPITALRTVSTAYRAGATWIIEGDLEDCFGSIPHHVILNCLRKRIRDERFIDLIRRMLKAGVMEMGRYQRTYSGVPQGGVASPILANVVLHELDAWMETHIGANPPTQTTQEVNARRNPEYKRLSYRIQDLRRYLDGKRPMPKGKSEAELRQELRETLAARRQVPSCLPRQVVYYARFADDFLIILCNRSKEEARDTKERTADWLQETLGLTLNPDKTLITHRQDRLRFLGYHLQGRRSARGTPWLYLSVPEDAMREVVAKIKQATAYSMAPEYDVFVNVNAIVRGWTNYYRFAHNSNKVAGRLINAVFWRVAHYLGKRHRQSIRKIMRRHYARDPRTGCKALFVQRPDAKPGREARYFIWHKRPKRLPLIANKATTVQDTKPCLNTSWATGHSLTQRVKAKAAAQGTCEGCGRSDVPLYHHHPSRLRNVKRDRKDQRHVIQSGYDQQGKILCLDCHLEHHHGDTRQ